MILLLEFYNRYKNTRHCSAAAAAAAAKQLQSCPTLCDPIDGSPPGSPVPGILQARTLEWDIVLVYGMLSFMGNYCVEIIAKHLTRISYFQVFPQSYEADHNHF